MNPASGTVFLLDDEPGMLKALTRLLRAEGFETQSFSTAQAFLDAWRPDVVSCLVLDVAMPELNGMELQHRLTSAGIMLPIVFLTGHGDIPMSVRAIKAGAVDFLTKPVNDDALIRAVRAALERSAEQRDSIAESAALALRLNQLTAREREVMRHVIAGKMNKQIAADLGTGEQNIKVHRARVMEKMGVQSVADLVRAAARLTIEPVD